MTTLSAYLLAGAPDWCFQCGAKLLEFRSPLAKTILVCCPTGREGHDRWRWSDKDERALREPSPWPLLLVPAATILVILIGLLAS